jgi:NTE family protein
MSALPPGKSTHLDHEHIALVLQGGGALGAYQAGVFDELSKIPHEPTWVSGVSIGAISAALIVGNEPHKRVERLREFWREVSVGLGELAPLRDGHRRDFYRPWMLPPIFQPEGTPASTLVDERVKPLP